MKNKLFRRDAVLIAALFSLTCISVTAYAQSDELAEETTPPAAMETVVKPFTPDGTERWWTMPPTCTARSFSRSPPQKNENAFHLIIDRQRTEENVYFLNAVTEKDLLALAEPEPEPEKDAGFPIDNLLMIAAVLLVGGGAAYYFKVYRPKHEAPESDEDDYDYDENDHTTIWRTRNEFQQ